MIYDAQAKPPDYMRELFKHWRKRPVAEIGADQQIIDPQKPDVNRVSALPESEVLGQGDLEILTTDFLGSATKDSIPGLREETLLPLRTAFEVKGVPGSLTLLVCHPPSQLTQVSSFFTAGLDTVVYPKDSAVHKPMTSAQMLERKLRWMTLGGQYDWTNKIYPEGEPPPFPDDIAGLLKKLFPTVDPQAAIVNFYSPGDTLSVHRDVSEASNNSLISISLGCDGIFLVGGEDEADAAAIRLRSGDAILMSGKSRHAWHGVPRILPGTCPPWLQDWPDTRHAGPYQHWRGWMSKKRINLNVRQMTD